METRKILEYALQREYEGKRFFEQNAERLNHAAAADAFKRLALEEQKHINFIQAQIEALQQDFPSNQMAEIKLEEVSFFSQRATQESLDQSVVQAMVPDLPVLRLAYLIEKDFAEFYESYANKVIGPAKQVLSMLAEWERRHEQLVKSFHDQAFELYSQMPWGG